MWNVDKTILDLYAGEGAWSEPYMDADYDVRRFDLRTTGHDIRLLPVFPGSVHGILIAAPCTHLAGSGARWWAGKGEQALYDALALVDAGLRFVAMYNPAWWALENPVGRLAKYLGPPRYTFDPCEHGDPYTKKTCLWGRFNIPARNYVKPVEGSKIHMMSPGPERQALRSLTPAGFAKAFFEANP